MVDTVHMATINTVVTYSANIFVHLPFVVYHHFLLFVEWLSGCTLLIFLLRVLYTVFMYGCRSKEEENV